KPGLFPLLDFLERRGVPKAVATSTGRERAMFRLEKCGLRSHFEHIVTGDEVTVGKPAPDIFLKTAEKLGVAPEECFVLEDTEAGVRAAHAARMKAICIPDVKQPCEEVCLLADRV